MRRLKQWMEEKGVIEDEGRESKLVMEAFWFGHTFGEFQQKEIVKELKREKDAERKARKKKKPEKKVKGKPEKKGK